MNNRLIAHLKTNNVKAKEFRHQYEVGKPVLNRVISLCQEYIEDSRVKMTSKDVLDSPNLKETIGYHLGYQAALYSIIKLIEE